MKYLVLVRTITVLKRKLISGRSVGRERGEGGGEQVIVEALCLDVKNRKQSQFDRKEEKKERVLLHS